jgi:hypothetical protein
MGLGSLWQKPAGVVAVDAAGVVVGYADVSDNRPDVPKAVAEVTRVDVGWHGFFRTNTVGPVNAYAVFEGMTAVCPISGTQAAPG